MLTKQQKLLLAFDLSSGLSVKDAAAKYGCCTMTIYRLLRRPAFRKVIARHRAQYMLEAAGKASENMSLAAQTIVELLKCEDPKIRMRAAYAMLRLGPQLRDSAEIDDRVVEYELEDLQQNEN
jgi:transposase